MRIQLSAVFVFVTVIMSALIAPTVSAQAGSRLCGWTADVPVGAVLDPTLTYPQGGKIAYLYEARESDDSYQKQCDNAIADFEKTIQADTVQRTYAWKKVKRNDCPSVGSEFTSKAQASTDMCDNMEGKKPYFISKSYISPKKDAATTLYRKI